MPTIPLRRVVGRWNGGRAGLVALAVVLPLVIPLLRILLDRHATFVEGDLALLHIDSLRAGHLHQLLGPYDRFGWKHPGPLDAYLLAGANFLVGSAHPLQVETTTAVMTNGAALAGAAYVAHRVLGRAAGRGTVLISAVMMIVLGNDLVLDPWTPLVVIAPLVLLMVLSVAAVRGSWSALAAAGLVGTYVVQTDVGTGPLAILLVGLAAAGGLLRQRRRSTQGARTRAPAATVLVLLLATALAWLPVAWEQFTSRPGNLTRLTTFFTTPHATLGWGAGLRAAGLGEWLAVSGRHGALLSSSGGYWALGAAGLGALFLVRAGRGPERMGPFGVVWLLGSAVAVIAASRIVGPPYWYLLAWCVAPVAVGLAGWLALLIEALGASRMGRALPVGIALAMLLVTGALAARPGVQSYSSRPVAAAWALVAPLAGPGLSGQPVGVAYGPDAASWSVGTGLVDRLAAAGRRVRVLPNWAGQLGPGYSGPAGEWIVVRPTGTPTGPGARWLGRAGPVQLTLAATPGMTRG